MGGGESEFSGVSWPPRKPHHSQCLPRRPQKFFPRHLDSGAWVVTPHQERPRRVGWRVLTEASGGRGDCGGRRQGRCAAAGGGAQEEGVEVTRAPETRAHAGRGWHAELPTHLGPTAGCRAPGLTVLSAPQVWTRTHSPPWLPYKEVSSEVVERSPVGPRLMLACREH